MSSTRAVEKPPSATRSAVLLAVTLLVVAANLRPTITALGPVLDQVGADTGLGATALGVLGAVPLLAFAVVSPLVHLLGRRWGQDRTVFVATLLLIAGTAWRSWPGSVANLWLGTVLLGASIAVCNVLVPALVKRDFPDEVPVMTGAYSAVLGTSAALASGVALPLAEVGGWRFAIGGWGVLSVLAALAWLPRLRRPDHAPTTRASDTADLRPTVWRSGTAWWVTAFMGTQAATFYLLVTWLPSIEAANGVDPARAGWNLFLYQAVGIVAGLGVAVLMRGRRDHRLVGALVSVALIVAMAGLLVLPGWSLLWIVLAGASGGSSLVVALALIGERARDTATASRLSGMAQSIGYALAAAGPIGAGVLFELTGSWAYPLLAVLLVGVLQLVVALVAGRDRYLGD